MSSSENSLVEIFGEISDPRQEGKVKHNLVELLIVAVVAVLCGADNFVKIELWAKSRLDWLRKYLTLEHGIASHDTFGAVFAGIDASQFAVCFSRWASGILPVSDDLQVLAIDGKTSRRTKNAAKNLATVKQLVINLIRSDTVKRKGGIKARRLIDAADVEYCQHLLHW